MAKRFPSLKAGKLEGIVERHCRFVRMGKGNHRIYENSAGQRFTFSFHQGDTVNPVLVRTVLVRDVGLSVELAEEAVGI